MHTEYRIEGRVDGLEDWIIICFKRDGDDAMAFVRTLVDREPRRKNGKRFSEFRVKKITIETIEEVEV